MATGIQKIQMISPAVPPHPSGEAFYVEKIAKALVERGHQVSILTSSRWGWRTLFRVVRKIRRDRPDWVWVHYTDWLFGRSLIQYLPLLVGSTQVLFLLHNHVHRALPQKWEPIRGWRAWLHLVRRRWMHGALNRSDRVVVLADWHARVLGRLFPSANIHVVPNFSFLSPLDPGQTSANRSLKLGFYGYVYSDKELEILFEAMVQVPDCTLTIFGGVPNDLSGTPQELEQKIRSYALGGRIRVRGNHDCRDPQVARQLQESDVVVLPYGTGVSTRRSSFAAALSLGIPVLTSRGKETENIYEEGEVAFYRAGCSSSLALQLRFLAEPSYRRRLAENGAALYRKVFHLDCAVKKFESLMDGGAVPEASHLVH